MARCLRLVGVTGLNMKTTHSFAFAILLSAAAPFAGHARTLEQTYIDSCGQSPAIPVPVSVVAPDVGASAAGKTLTARFQVDKTGRPSAITVLPAGADRGLRTSVAEAVRQWRFRPARVDGAVVAMTVVVPFRFVPPANSDFFIPDFVRKGRLEN
jgi:TonB family protein